MFDRIVVDPRVCGGKPYIKGTRIPVTMVLELLEDELSFADISRDYYPSLTMADIKACVEYARELVEGEEIYFVQEQVA